MLFTLLPDLSVAPLKYAHVHRDHGGPVAAISFRERGAGEGKLFEAFATLDKKSTGFVSERNLLYGGSDGMGTGPTKAEAIYAAISEAIERWAWQSAERDPSLRRALRYDLDPSTTGFAAFPGLGFQGARKRAFFEAAERWSLCAWWEGALPHAPLKPPGPEGIQIRSPIPGASVAVLWEEKDGLVAYGFAASHANEEAAGKARVELHRNQEVLSHFAAERARGLSPLSLTERRLHYFAEPEGHKRFLERVARQGTAAQAPALAVDRNVPGPWSQYAHVWRCLFEGGAFRENDREDYFLF